MQHPTLAELISALRSALNYLYDPVQLRSSPLIAWLGLAEEPDRASALRVQLTAAIRALKPADDEEPQSRVWRVYDLLHFRYIRQLSRDAVATQLGISLRQLRREQRAALEILAQQLQILSDQTDLAPLTHPAVGVAADEQAEVVDGIRSARGEQALNEELAWFKKGSEEAVVPLSDALHMVRQLVCPFAARWQVELRLDVPMELAKALVPLPVLRSILPTILTIAIPRARQKSITLAAVWVRNNITVHVIAPGSGVMPLTDAEVAALHTAEQLAIFHHARLAVPTRAETDFVVILSLPQSTQVKVLVIDDNPDWIELQRRYVSAARYQVIGSSDSIHATETAVQVQPSVIVLDVMIQAVDGWQILSELRHEPATAEIPVVICTILPVGELALALGADAFMQKPVSQESYLAMLERWST